MIPVRARACSALLLTLAGSAAAHHRQTPEVRALTTSGDTGLPRVAAQGTKTLTLAVDAGPALPADRHPQPVPHGGAADRAGVYTYDPTSRTFARITDDPGGCARPGVSRVKRDWRITFVCGGQPYFYMLRADQRYLVQTGGGVTERVLGELGIHFLVLGTTADLLGGGVTPGQRVYMINLFKRPAQPVAGLATWFPTRGIPPL